MKILLIIGGAIFALFVTLNIAAALSPNLLEAIQGLPLADQLLLVAQKTDELDTKTKNLEQDLANTKQQLEAEKAKNATLGAELKTENQDIKKQLYCQELKKKTPANGPMQFINQDIVGYYQNVSTRLEEVKIKPSRPDDPEDAVAELKFYTEVTAEAKPMYDKYMAECGNL